MSDWYLVYSKARQEETAAKGLLEQGYRVYLPKIRERKRRSQGMVFVDGALFPRYLFVAPGESEQSMAPAQHTVGVQKLVRFGAEYLPVPANVVDALVSREDPETGLHVPEPRVFRRGDRLRIASGVLAGLEGVFEARSGQDRVIILLELLGQRARTEVSQDEIDRPA